MTYDRIYFSTLGKREFKINFTNGIIIDLIVIKTTLELTALCLKKWINISGLYLMAKMRSKIVYE